MNIAIVDYGVGNLQSVANALRYLGVQSYIAASPAELERADAVILPGVGAFPDAADKLRAGGLDRAVVAQGEKKPVLGICLGMQLLLERGEEGRGGIGLGVVGGTVARIETARKLPHIGWNSITPDGGCPLFRGIDTGAYVYFVHSFSAQGVPAHRIAATTDYGTTVVATVAHGNFFGCQFHPEKSGETGLVILRNFATLNS